MTGTALFLFLLFQAGAQERPPYIGYVYPAGGQKGETFEAKIGGENVYGTSAAIVSGKGITVEVTDSREPEGLMDGNKKKRKKKQTVIDEIVKLKITIAKDAEPGAREICLVTPRGLSNKRVFHVGQLKETREVEPNAKKGEAVPLPALPVTVNGQVMPGDVDVFQFSAKKGRHLVIEASARALIPYIADAVPGWFQAILTLSDAQGKEVAVADDFRFNQDPVLFFDVPADGDYRLFIRDSIYRGREDFVYRIRIGELPFITGVFPPGAPRGEKPVPVKLFGKNLPSDSLSVSVNQDSSVQLLSVTRNGLVSNRVPFAVDTLPEILESDAAASREVALPVIINGRIRKPGEKDSFRFAGKKDQTVSLEVRARRLGSPLDSCLVLLNGRGEKLAENDDTKDPGEGLLTHLADSALSFKLPEDGTYTACVYDMQGKGGDEYAYRLRISPPVPDFELRATPSELGIPRGGSAALTVHAIRRDGFAGEVKIFIEEPSPAGLSLEGAVIPEGMDRIRMTVSASAESKAETIFPRLRGTAVVDGKTVSKPLVPAEELMQAFAFQHLVPSVAQVVTISEPGAPFTVSLQLPQEGRLTLPRGKETSFRVTATRRPGFDGPIRLQLVDPPKGITLRGWGIPKDRNMGFATVRVEGDTEAKPNDNLIFICIMPIEREEAVAVAGKEKPAADNTLDQDKKDVKADNTTDPAKKGDKAVEKKKPPMQRLFVTLPAVPFRIVENPEGKKNDAGKNQKF